jgi:hypothetical protein
MGWGELGQAQREDGSDLTDLPPLAPLERYDLG